MTFYHCTKFHLLIITCYYLLNITWLPSPPPRSGVFPILKGQFKLWGILFIEATDLFLFDPLFWPTNEYSFNIFSGKYQ